MKRTPCIVGGMLLVLCLTGTAQTTSLRPDYNASYIVAVTDKSGLFSFAAHRHAILVVHWTATVPADRSSIRVSVPSAGLVVDSGNGRRLAQLGDGPSPSDVKSIQARMLGPDVLDAARFPELAFASTSIEPSGTDQARVSGDFTLHGQQHPVSFLARSTRGADGTTTWDASFTIRQTAYGMSPVTVAGGTVKVKDEVEVRIHLRLLPGE